jgi:hypothetical protein
LAGDRWPDAFSPLGFHGDYPLLVPATNARLWSWAGREALWGPAAVQAGFLVALLGVVAGGVALLRGWPQALLATLALAGNIKLLLLCCSQYAETSLQFYFAAAIVLLGLRDVLGGIKRGELALIGLLAGLAAWTKNEGVLFLLALGSARLGVVAWRERRQAQTTSSVLSERPTPWTYSAQTARPSWWQTTFDELWPAVLGALPVVAILAIFKLSLHVENDLVAGQGASTLARLVDPERIAYVVRSWVTIGLHVLKLFAFVLPAMAWLLGRGPQLSRRGSGLPTGVALVGLMIAGFTVVLLATPHDLVWHVTTSVDRLWMQLYPFSIWMLFVGCATVAEKAATDKAIEEAEDQSIGTTAKTEPTPLSKELLPRRVA